MTDTHIKINAVTPRVQYTGNGSTTVFPYEFPIFDETDMVVYVDKDIIESGYTVSGAGETEGGNVTFDVAPEDGVVITLLRNVPIERITDFQEGGTFRPKNINDELDRQTAFAQQVQEALDRCVKVDPTSESNPEEILPKIEEIYEDVDKIVAVSEDLENIDAVSSGLEDIGTCATNMEAIQDAPTQAANAANSASDAAESAQQAAQSAAVASPPPLFYHHWYDYELDDVSWLRADTFSWQDGTVYSNAYQHLVDDIDGKTATSETVGSYTISYYLADDGHKITTDETTVANIYNESGVAWYYIIDTTNQRFKLPRENPNREKLLGKLSVVPYSETDSVPYALYKRQDGGDSGRELPMQAGYYSTYPNGWVTLGATNANYTHPLAWGSKTGLGVDLESGTGIYKGQKYLYFYVGQFTQSATQQTAGLNSELFNGKVDLNAQNLSNAGKSLIASLGMPSDTYDSLTLLSSGSDYTAPANGWFCISKVAGASGKYIGMECGKMFTQAHSSGNTDYLEIYMPVKKGDKVVVSYNATGNTNNFNFIYAKGSESEAE